ncbi:hypothetical protein MRX96_026873 [Rhipicephalus microplus]
MRIDRHRCFGVCGHGRVGGVPANVPLRPYSPATHPQCSRAAAAHAIADERARTRSHKAARTRHSHPSRGEHAGSGRGGEIGRTERARTGGGSRRASAAAAGRQQQAINLRKPRGRDNGAAPFSTPPSSALSELAAAAQRTATRGDCAPRPAFSSLVSCKSFLSFFFPFLPASLQRDPPRRHRSQRPGCFVVLFFFPEKAVFLQSPEIFARGARPLGPSRPSSAKRAALGCVEAPATTNDCCPRPRSLAVALCGLSHDRVTRQRRGPACRPSGSLC